MALLFGLSAGALLPIVAMADVIPLAPVPDLNGGVNSLPEYLNAVFRVVIIVGAILAVLRIIWSGFEYMTSEAVGQKKDARGVITAAIGGLILLIATTLILTVINPSIVNLDALNFNTLDMPSEKEPGTFLTPNVVEIKFGTLPNKLGASEADRLERGNFATEDAARSATNGCGDTVCTVKSIEDPASIPPIRWKIQVDPSTVLKKTQIKTESSAKADEFVGACSGLATKEALALSGVEKFYIVTCVQ